MLFTANSADANHSGQSFCLWSTKNQRYCSNSWFIRSVCPSVCRWKAINNFVLIPNILFSSFISSAANCSPLSDTTLSGNSCSFYTLSLNNLANPFADIPSVVATKCVILDNLSQTTKIASFPATTGNFIIKSTVKCVYGFPSTSLNFNFPANSLVLFLIFWHKSHPSTYLLTSLITPSHQ